MKPSIDIVTIIVQDDLVNERPVGWGTRQLEMFFIVETVNKAPE